MICPLLEEIEQVNELELIVNFFIHACRKGEARNVAASLRNLLIAKWTDGQRMSRELGSEESGKIISEYAIMVLNQAGVIMR